MKSLSLTLQCLGGLFHASSPVFEILPSLINLAFFYLGQMSCNPTVFFLLEFVYKHKAFIILAQSLYIPHPFLWPHNIFIFATFISMSLPGFELIGVLVVETL
ncbi:unnamed protein product [Cuscuta europaea]|uniref:Uncharacterized protein n=1 Tax=Cuscuta europaea TaxID=41803 RepID=A0A9P1E455_CUSEU|nr:unnamed protein product [Cuscuta europaea]